MAASPGSKWRCHCCRVMVLGSSPTVTSVLAVPLMASKGPSGLMVGPLTSGTAAKASPSLITSWSECHELRIQQGSHLVALRVFEPHPSVLLSQKIMRDVTAVVLTFNVTHTPSFTWVRNWCHAMMKPRRSQCPVLAIVATHVDMESRRMVSSEEAQRLASSVKTLYVETHSHDVYEAWHTLLQALLELPRSSCQTERGHFRPFRPGVKPWIPLSALFGPNVVVPASSPAILPYDDRGGMVDQLRTCIQHGNMKQLRQLLRRVDPSILNCEHRTKLTTALMEAANVGDVDMLSLLLSSGADPTRTHPTTGLTALHAASHLEHYGSASALVTAGADPNAMCNRGETPLFHAVASWATLSMKQLFQLGARVDTVNCDGCTVLHMAAWRGNVVACKFLLRKECAVDVVDRHHMTPLMYAASGGHLDVVKALLEAQADPRKEHPVLGNALHQAASGGHVGVTKYFVKELKMDVHAVNGQGNDVLFSAMSGSHAVAEYVWPYVEGSLLGDKKNYRGDTTLCLAAENGIDFIVSKCIRLGHDVSAPNLAGHSPLMLACMNGHTAVARLLLQHGASIDTLDKRGFTAFMYACANGHVDIVKLLLRQDGQYNVPGYCNDCQDSALSLAVSQGHVIIVTLLVRHLKSPNCVEDPLGSPVVHTSPFLHAHLQLSDADLLLTRDLHLCDGVRTCSATYFGARVLVQRWEAPVPMPLVRAAVALQSIVRQHPYVAPLLGVAQDARGGVSMVMDVAPAATLQQLMRCQDQPLALDWIVCIASDLARALSRLNAPLLQHTPRILVRNLCPANVIITDRGNACFGPLVGATHRDTPLLSRVGNVRRLAPEGLLGLPASPATEVYAFGMLLFEMLSGEEPFVDVPVSRMTSHVAVEGNRPVLPLHANQGSHVWATLCALMEQCWAEDPSQRPALDGVLTVLDSLGASTESSLTGSQHQRAALVAAARAVWASSPCMPPFPTPSVIKVRVLDNCALRTLSYPVMPTAVGYEETSVADRRPLHNSAPGEHTSQLNPTLQVQHSYHVPLPVAQATVSQGSRDVSIVRPVVTLTPASAPVATNVHAHNGHASPALSASPASHHQSSHSRTLYHYTSSPDMDVENREEQRDVGGVGHHTRVSDATTSSASPATERHDANVAVTPVGSAVGSAGGSAVGSAVGSTIGAVQRRATVSSEENTQYATRPDPDHARLAMGRSLGSWHSMSSNASADEANDGMGVLDNGAASSDDTSPLGTEDQPALLLVPSPSHHKSGSSESSQSRGVGKHLLATSPSLVYGSTFPLHVASVSPSTPLRGSGAEATAERPMMQPRSSGDSNTSAYVDPHAPSTLEPYSGLSSRYGATVVFDGMLDDQPCLLHEVPIHAMRMQRWPRARMLLERCASVAAIPQVVPFRFYDTDAWHRHLRLFSVTVEQPLGRLIEAQRQRGCCFAPNQLAGMSLCILRALQWTQQHGLNACLSERNVFLRSPNVEYTTDNPGVGVRTRSEPNIMDPDFLGSDVKTIIEETFRARRTRRHSEHHSHHQWLSGSKKKRGSKRGASSGKRATGGRIVSNVEDSRLIRDKGEAEDGEDSKSVSPSEDGDTRNATEGRNRSATTTAAIGSSQPVTMLPSPGGDGFAAKHAPDAVPLSSSMPRMGGEGSSTSAVPKRVVGLSRSHLKERERELISQLEHPLCVADFGITNMLTGDGPRALGDAGFVAPELLRLMDRARRRRLSPPPPRLYGRKSVGDAAPTHSQSVGGELCGCDHPFTCAHCSPAMLPTVSPAAAIFSFGMLLWTMVTLHVPFHDHGDPDRCVRKGTSLHHPVLPASYQVFFDIVEQCTSGSAARRPSAAKLIRRLASCKLSCESAPLPSLQLLRSLDGGHHRPVSPSMGTTRGPTYYSPVSHQDLRRVRMSSDASWFADDDTSGPGNRSDSPSLFDTATSLPPYPSDPVHSSSSPLVWRADVWSMPLIHPCHGFVAEEGSVDAVELPKGWNDTLEPPSHGYSDYEDYFQYAPHCFFWGSTVTGLAFHLYISLEPVVGSDLRRTWSTAKNASQANDQEPHYRVLLRTAQRDTRAFLPVSSKYLSKSKGRKTRRKSGGLLTKRLRRGDVATPPPKRLARAALTELSLQVSSNVIMGSARVQPDEAMILLSLESRFRPRRLTIGILYAVQGQTTEVEMLRNTQVSHEFNTFLNTLGNQIKLSGWPKWSGGLDTKYNATGEYSLFTDFAGCQIMFHVSLMLCYDADDEDQVQRQRHLASDEALIIFQDSTTNTPIPPSAFSSPTNHIFAVVRQMAPEAVLHGSLPAGPGGRLRPLYRLAVARRDCVEPFEPQLPPGVYEGGPDFRTLLLSKIMHGMHSVYTSDTSISHERAHQREVAMVEAVRRIDHSDIRQ